MRQLGTHMSVLISFLIRRKTQIHEYMYRNEFSLDYIHLYTNEFSNRNFKYFYGGMGHMEAKLPRAYTSRDAALSPLSLARAQLSHWSFLH